MALILMAAVGSYGTQGHAETHRARHAAPIAHVAKSRVVTVKHKSAKTIRAKTAVRAKSWSPNGMAIGIYSFTA